MDEAAGLRAVDLAESREEPVLAMGPLSAVNGMALVSDGKRAGVYLAEEDVTICFDDDAPGVVNLVYAEIQPEAL